MNYNKVIKDLKERNDKLENQRRQFEIRLINEQYLVEKKDKEIERLQEKNERLKEIAKKMHLWIFLHSGDEQKVYDELGLTDEENTILGYSGQIRIGSDDNE